MTDTPITHSALASVDEYFMELALAEARIAALRGDVPVGAVVVVGGVLIAKGSNRTHTAHDPAGHAEVIALRRAAQVMQSPRIPNTTLYVTLEPCTMCVGAMVQARISRLVYAAAEPKTGAVCSAFNLLEPGLHNHSFEINAGLQADASALLLQDFFAARRKRK